MKFIVNTGTLLKHLQYISGVVGSNNILPILENFLFDIDKKKLTLFATDLEISMTSSLEIDCKESAKIAIPAKILLDTLKTLPEQPLTFTVNTKNFAIEISSDNGKYRLAGENGEDFPKIPIAEETNNLPIPASVLSEAISKTFFAISTNDDMRPAMSGLYVQLSPENVTFVATDAQKLVLYRRKDVISDSASSFIVPKKALGLLKNALPHDDSSVTISYNRSNAFFHVGQLQLICRLIDARFPDYNAAIPINNPNKLTIGRVELMNSLKRMVIFSNKSTSLVLLKIKGNELHLSAQDLDFSNEAFETLTCTYEGEDMEIGFNGKFLIEMLNTLDGDEVTFELSAPSRPAVLVPAEKEEKEEILMLVMSLIINQ